MKRMLILAALALAGCGQSPATQRESEAITRTIPGPVTTTPTPPAASIPAQRFAQQVANSNAFEMEASQVALQRAERAPVREFARSIAAEREASTRELAQIAPQVELATPTPKLDSAQQNKLNSLRSAPNYEFDDAYLDQQVAQQREAVRTFEAFVNTAPESPLRQWAQQKLPKLQDRLARAEALEEAT
jgi:putative membrane protein